MWLPGEHAKAFRGQAADILTRYFAGDSSLHAEVEANAESGGAINEAARAALPTLGGEGGCGTGGSKRRKTIGKMEEELAMVRAVAMSTKEQNEHLRGQIELKTQLFGMELSYERDKLSLDGQGRAQELEYERTKYSLIEEDRKSELNYRRELKAIENGPTAGPVGAQVPMPAPIVDPSTYTTVLKVFTAHQSEFIGVSSRHDKERLLRVGGVKAAAAFRAQWGKEPAKTNEGELEVLEYPSEAEALVMSSLRESYRDIRAGMSQRPIRAYLVVA
jgi:hypothetical protein